MKNRKIIFIILLITVLFLSLLPTVVKADTSEIEDTGSGKSDYGSDPIDNPGGFKPGGPGDIDVVTDKANSIVGIIVTVGVVVSVVTMAALGIKYMFAGVAEKAEYKKSMIPYIIGAVLLFSTSVIVNIIANIVQESNLAK